ncbi:MAG: PAC2 family protein [Thermoplasmata archaeon]|nr:PAC2 family protein [Thermoplasmata archaeon]MCI4359819.1 PAC2 family protein [Thermoplasmata archaeon]
MAVSAEEIRIVDTRDEPLQGAMMVIGFPTHGLVGSVAASYLVHALDMTSVAYMTSERFPPTVIMEEGVVSAPVRFYVSKLVCGVDRSCQQLLVAISDIQPPPELLPALSRRLLDWAETKGVQLLVVVEGQPVDEQVHGDARVVAMANRAAAPLLAKYSFEPANGVVTGFAGGLLLSAIGRQLPVLCLVAQAHKDFPDARAAAKVIESINPLVPLMVLDTKPLREKAEEIEAEVRQTLKQSEKSLSGMRPPDVGGPGEMYR